MVQNPDFLYCVIGKNEYLIPSGMAIVNRANILQLIGSTKQIWDMHEKDISEDEVISYMKKCYEPENYDEWCELRTDTRLAYSYLKKNGCIITLEQLRQRQKEDTVIENDELCINGSTTGYDVIMKEDGKEYQTKLLSDAIKEEYDLERIAKQSYEERIVKRIGYSRKALLEGKVFLHSVSILYRDKVWIFAAPAGIGKSTHAKMWVENDFGKIINGDLNLIGMKDDVLYAYGTPWCGTSEQYSLSDYPVGGVIILTRGYKDYIEDISYEDTVLGLLSRSISPRWDAKMLKMNLDIVKSIVEKCMVCKLRCTTKQSAVMVMKEYIDCYLEKK